MRTVVVNAGSSNLKLSVIDAGQRTVAASTLDRHGDDVELEELRQLAAEHGPVDAVGHRIVHGGTEFTEAAFIDGSVLDHLEALVPLAPLHQRAGLDGVRAAAAALPGVPNVACFDTAFHATLPPAAATYALPPQWRERWGLRRFGFHGLSHAWASQRAAALVGRPVEDLRIISCHLGSGASLCAINQGCSVDTTMGFTPLEGLVMATRSGTVDPGMLLWLIEQGGLPAAEVADRLERASGLAGLSGTGGDIRDVLAAADSGDASATLALDVWVHRLRRESGAMAAAMDGTDMLVFTGGIGEHEPGLRARAAAGLGFLGIHIDPASNASATSDADISTRGAPCHTLVVTAREDLAIAQQVEGLLGSVAP